MTGPADVDLTDLSLWVDGPPREALRALREHDPVHWNPPPDEWSGCEHDGAGFWSLTRAADVAADCPQGRRGDPEVAGAGDVHAADRDA